MPASMRVRERETVTLAEAQWKNKGSYLSLAAADALGPTQPRSTAVLSAATSRFLCPIRLLLGFRFCLVPVFSLACGLCCHNTFTYSISANFFSLGFEVRGFRPFTRPV